MAWALVSLGWLWLLVWSLPVASHVLRAQLEGAYPPLALKKESRNTRENALFVAKLLGHRDRGIAPDMD